MPWEKGQSGNPNGAPKGSRKQSNSVQALIKRGSKASLKLLCAVVEGTKDASIGEQIKAGQYLIDRDLGKPETLQGTQGGMFQGAQIVVHTGFQDAPRPLTAPTIDMPVNGHAESDADKPSD